ncbi:MAG: Stealth CR1 domain-containing protein [Candidatus Saccharimonadales bacterium]
MKSTNKLPDTKKTLSTSVTASVASVRIGVTKKIPSKKRLTKLIRKTGKHLKKDYRWLYDFLRAAGRLYFIFSKNSGAAHYAKKRRGFVIVQYGHKFMVARNVNKFSSLVAKTRNLDEVVAICRKAKIVYSCVPGFSDARERVLIFHKDREKFLDVTNRHLRNKGFYLSDNAKNKRRFKLVNGHGLPGRFYTRDILYLFHLEAKNSVTFADANNRCDIEFWFDEEEARRRELPADTMFDGKKLAEIRNCWIAPTNNRVATILTPDQRKMRTKRIGGKDYNAFLPFSKKYSDELDISFPVDVVYTWVDGDDPKWRKKYETAKRQLDPSFVSSNTASRYTSRDELKYSLRGLAMYAPWIHKIYIITDDQKPKWLKENDRLRIVSHREIFSKKSALPVFNSHAIEAQMHNIPNLAEHYIYFNDDFSLTSHAAPSLFFNDAGLAKLFPSRALFGVGGQMSPESIPSIAGSNDAKLLAKRFGIKPTHKFGHAPFPQVRSVAKETAQSFSKDFANTSTSRFRNKSDISPVTLINHYSLIKGRAIRAKYKLSVVDISKWDDDYARWILHRKPRAMCLNDTVDMSDEQKDIIEPKLREFLGRMFPFKSEWEK